MLKFLIIEAKSHEKLDETVLVSLFSEFIHITDIKRREDGLSFFFSGDVDEYFEDVILNVMTDTLTDLRMYVSYAYLNDQERFEAHQYILTILKKVPFGTYYYLDNSRILNFLGHHIDESIKRFILRKFYDDQVMLETLLVYFESNLNMIHAAKKLYIHRNTLIQRLDKFAQTTGFDPRKFIDAHQIYNLIGS